MESSDSKPRRCSFANLHLLARSTFYFLVDLFFKDTIFYSAIKRDDSQVGYENLEKAAEFKLKARGEEAEKAAKQRRSNVTATTVRHFEFLDGYRGLCNILVISNHTRMNMKEPGEFGVLDGFTYAFSIHGFFVLSAFLLTYRFIKELDTRLERHYQTTDNRSETTSIRMHRLRDEIKIFSLITIKYAFRRFFRIYVTFLFYVKSFENVYFKKLGYCHLWTIPSEIKYYFCIPVICLLFVKLKRYALFLIILGFLFVFANEEYQFLPYNLDNYTVDGGTLTSFFTIFLCGSLIGALYYFFYEQLDSSSTNQVLFSSSFRFLLTYKNTKSPIKRRFFDVFLSLTLLQVYYVAFVHYSSYWNDYSIHTDVLMRLLGFEPRRLENRIHFGVIFSFVLFLMLVFDPLVFSSIFKSPLLKFAGLYSYSTYLIHTSFWRFPIQDLFKSNLEYLATILTLCYFCGFFLFYLTENPLMNLANFLCRKVEKSRFFK